MTSLPPQPPRPRTVGNVTRIETTFETRLRMMIAYVARQQAREAVILRIKREGKVKVALMSRAQITRLAMAHLRAHSEELLREAEASGVVQRLLREEAAKSANMSTPGYS